MTFCVKGCLGHVKICISPQFWASDDHFLRQGLLRRREKLHFTTVLGVRRSLFALRVASATWKIAFHHSFGRQTITFCVKGRSATWKICISPQFWTSDEHEVTRGLSPAATYQTYPAEKKRRNFTEEQHFRRAAVSAALLSSLSQQLFSAAFLSSSSQQLFSAALLSSSAQQLFSAALLSSFSLQPFSAALLSSFSQQPFSAALISSFSQQPFSAALLSSFSQQPFSAALLSSSSQQIFSAALLSSSSQQLFSAAFLSSSSQQLFSAIILLWSGVGGQLVTSSSAALLSSSSQQLFSAIILLWSGVGGQVCYRSLEGPFRNAFGKRYIYNIYIYINKCEIKELQSKRLLEVFCKAYYSSMVWRNLENTILTTYLCLASFRVILSGLKDRELFEWGTWKQHSIYLGCRMIYQMRLYYLGSTVHPVRMPNEGF